MNLDPAKPFRRVCQHHDCDLEPDGHGVGLGGEDWPGVSINYETMEWFLTGSNLICPGLEDGWTEEQYEACRDSWKIVQEGAA